MSSLQLFLPGYMSPFLTHLTAALCGESHIWDPVPYDPQLKPRALHGEHPVGCAFVE